MNGLLRFACLGLLWFGNLACKKDPMSDLENIYQDEKLTIDISATPIIGYSPLDVSFSAYLETEDRTVDQLIHEVKWLITGPNGFRREIIQNQEYFQEGDDHRESFFYLDYLFGVEGRYTAKLILNDGAFSSKNVTITVKDPPGINYRRY